MEKAIWEAAIAELEAGEREATEWITRRGSSWNSGQSCTVEDFTDELTVFMSHEQKSSQQAYLKKYCTNGMCRRYQRFLDWQLIKKVTVFKLIIHWFN